MLDIVLDIRKIEKVEKKSFYFKGVFFIEEIDYYLENYKLRKVLER